MTCCYNQLTINFKLCVCSDEMRSSNNWEQWGREWRRQTQYQIHINGILMLGIITDSHHRISRKNILFFFPEENPSGFKEVFILLKCPDMHWLIEFNISGHFLCCSCSCNHFLQSSDLLPSAVLCTFRTKWSPNNLFAKKLSDYDFYLCSKLNLIIPNLI